MKKYLLRSLLLPALLAALHTATHAQQCLFTIEMLDNFGDGWNGGVLTVVNAGTTNQFSLVNTIGNGADSTVTFSVTPGLPLVLNWAPGGFNNEVSFALYNNDGDLLFQIANPTPGVVFLLPAAACVDCLKPLNPVIENIWDTRVRVAWTPAFGSGTPIGWRVTYGPAGFDPGAGNTLYVGVPRANITGLQPKTWYDYYVEQDCGGDTSKRAGPFTFETYRTNDVGVSAVLSPQNSCDLGVETITLALRNYGANPQSLVPFNYSVNDVPVSVPQPQDGFYTGVLGKDSAAIIEFETLYDFSAPGEYRIAVWTEMNGDEDPANDTFFYRVVNRLATPYSQNFEDCNGAWYVDTANSIAPSWQFGTPAGSVISAAADGKNAWVTNLTGPYNPGEISYLNSPCFDFSDLATDPVIEFSLIYATESGYDGCWLEMSLDDGDSWAKVGMLDENINWYNQDITFTDIGHAWSGNSNGWITARHLLDGAAGLANVRLRFAFESDPFILSEGTGVDDIRIYAPLTDDLAALSVRTDADGQDCGDTTDVVTFRLANFGAQPATIFGLAYSLNGTAPVVENVGTVTIAPNDVYTYVFNQTFDSRDGLFAVRCWTVLPNEQNRSNDTSAVYMVDHLPDPLPLSADFETGLPAGWTSTGFTTTGHNNISTVLASNLYDFNATSTTDLSRVGFVGPNDSLSFDYRITDFDTDGETPTILANGTRFEVLVSSDCGSSFQTVYTIDQSNHTPSVDLQNVRIGLGAYAGLAIQIRFAGVWGAGDFYFDLDNINLPQLPITPTRDGIEGLSKLDLWPNPTTGRTQVLVELDKSADLQVQMLDLMGRTVWQTNTLRSDRLSENLDLTPLPSGLYLLRLTVNGQSVTRKVVKQ
ncbi:MAG: T9SS type A sorting domain-containing protein [Lewinellaceae bacterium]|nr:T9SS type A sorting domain-containing protein [Lewinellaceae bacterium]